MSTAMSESQHLSPVRSVMAVITPTKNWIQPIFDSGKEGGRGDGGANLHKIDTSETVLQLITSIVPSLAVNKTAAVHEDMPDELYLYRTLLNCSGTFFFCILSTCQFLSFFILC